MLIKEKNSLPPEGTINLLYWSPFHYIIHNYMEIISLVDCNYRFILFGSSLQYKCMPIEYAAYRVMLHFFNSHFIRRDNLDFIRLH